MEVIFFNAVMAGKLKSSCGTHIFNHLAADGASLTGSQVAVVTVGQVNANFLCSLHLETVHSFTCLGNIDLIIVLHNNLSPFLRLAFASLVFPESQVAFPRENILSFRNSIFAECGRCMSVSFRKTKQKMETNEEAFQG